MRQGWLRAKFVHPPPFFSHAYPVLRGFACQWQAAEVSLLVDRLKLLELAFELEHFLHFLLDQQFELSDGFLRLGFILFELFYLLVFFLDDAIEFLLHLNKRLVTVRLGNALFFLELLVLHHLSLNKSKLFLNFHNFVLKNLVVVGEAQQLVRLFLYQEIFLLYKLILFQKRKYRDRLLVLMVRLVFLITLWWRLLSFA